MTKRILTARRAALAALVVLATALPLPAAAAPVAKPRTLLLPRTMEAACPPDVLTEDGFLDVLDTNPHERAIDCAYWWGIVRGVESLESWPTGEGRAPAVRFDPLRGATRGQAASLIFRLIEVASPGTVPASSTDAFKDDDGSPHEDAINALVAAGVMEGRPDGQAHADEPLDRGAATSLVIRALEEIVGDAEPGLPPSGGDVFDDDNGSPHEGAIDTAADAGIVAGTPDGGFHPTDAVRRDQLASLVSRGLDWLVEAGHVATPSDDPAGFYGVPDELAEGHPGDLIKSEQLADAPAGGTAYRVMYHSESVDSRDVAVTGVVVVPAGAAPEGGWPVMTLAHGTTGIADQCAPSLGGATGYAAPFVEAGYLAAVTDYEGLGTPGRHPYVAGISEGRSTLDIVRAARQLVPEAGTRYGIWGHSQGGHAALFAAQYASKWMPELEAVGAVAGAPGTELPLLAAAFRNSPYQGYLAMGAAGINAAYPEADLSLVLTPEGLDLIGVVDVTCSPGVHAAFSVPYERIAAADPNEVEPWATLLHTNNPGEEAFDVPVLIVHGTADDQIPVVATQLLFDRMCGLGQNVQRLTYEGAGHTGVIDASRGDVEPWIAARFAGEPAETGCPR